jgi:dolichol-phosphate mannosyltransferase
MDADLQDPPELLPDMMRLMDEGADVVFGQRIERDGESWFKRLTAAAFYRILSWMTDVPIPKDTGDFRLMRREVINILLDMPEQHRFIRGMVAWIGFNQVSFPYKRDRRFSGTTKYPLRKMIRFAIDAITGFSMVPLRLSAYMALLFLVVAVVLGVYVIYSWFFLNAIQGWASVLLVLLIFSGVQLLSLGIIGEYLGRTYMQTKQRPLFVIREVATIGRTFEHTTKGLRHVRQ